jgi:CelD/BcsL family acetyltransferase involved in cellulose biosynthesis
MWAQAAARAFTNGQVRLATAGGASITAVAPLFQTAGSKTLTVLGTELFEITDFSYADASAAEAVAKEILKLGAPVFLRSVNADSLLLEALRKVCRRRRIMITRPRPGSPWLPLDDSWKDPESHLNSGRRSDLRRARRRAEKLGAVRTEFLRPQLDELPRLLEIAFRVESANWKGRISSSLETNPEVGCFYRHYAQAACQRGMLHLGYLWIGDVPVAMQLAVEYNNGFWLLKMGFDEKFRSCSPGTLLMVESLRYAAEHAWQEYAILGVSEPWNQMWTPLIRDHVSIRIYAGGLGGLYSAIGDGLAYLMRNGSSASKPFKPARMPAGLRSSAQAESKFRQVMKNVPHFFVVL